jgi:ParB family chromosome partitioning protein
LTEIPAIIRSFSEETRVAVALIENIQRADLNPVEEAAAYRQLMETAGLSQDEAAARVGKNRSTLANALRLLKLPPAMQDALKSGFLSAGHARAILSLDSEAEREVLFAAIMKEGISVREAERRASKGGGKGGKTEKQTDGKTKPDAELRAINQKFIEALGTKVSIEGTLEKGQIRIDYFSGEGLQRVYDVITASIPTGGTPLK